MRRCVICGNPGEEGSTVCPVCGNPLIDIPNPEEEFEDEGIDLPLPEDVLFYGMDQADADGPEDRDAVFRIEEETQNGQQEKKPEMEAPAGKEAGAEGSEGRKAGSGVPGRNMTGTKVPGTEVPEAEAAGGKGSETGAESAGVTEAGAEMSGAKDSEKEAEDSGELMYTEDELRQELSQQREESRRAAREQEVRQQARQNVRNQTANRGPSGQRAAGQTANRDTYAQNSQAQSNREPYSQNSQPQSNRAPYGQNGQAQSNRAPYGQNGQPQPNRTSYGQSGQGQSNRAPYGQNGQGQPNRASYSQNGQAQPNRAPYGQNGQPQSSRAPYPQNRAGQPNRAPYGQGGQPMNRAPYPQGAANQPGRQGQAMAQGQMRQPQGNAPRQRRPAAPGTGMRQGAYGQRLIAQAKKMFRSPLFLLVVLMNTVALGVSVAGILRQELDYSGLLSVLRNFEMPGEALVYVDRIMNLLSKVEGVTVVGLAGKLPGLILCIGLWILLITAFRKKEGMASSGFLITKIYVILQMVISCAVLVVCLVVAVTLVVSAWVSGGRTTLIASVVFLVLMIVFSMATIMYFFCLLHALKACRKNAVLGETAGTIPLYAPVATIAIALVSIVALLSAIVNAEIAGIISYACQIGWMVLLGIWMLLYRSKMMDE